MPAALSSPKIQMHVWFGMNDRGFHVFCPVCGHDDFHKTPRWHEGPLWRAVIEDAYYRALCMHRDHYPYGGDCGDWMSDGSEDV